MTKQQKMKIRRQSKFEFIANNKVYVEEEVEIEEVEILSKRKNEHTGEESESGRLINLDIPIFK